MADFPEAAGIRAVLFDLDGTFADTAPDLGGSINRLRKQRGMAPLPIAAIRAHASSGARGMLRAAFGLAPDDPEYLPLRDAFLADYAENLCVESRIFPGTPELLAQLASRGITWGIVTNKAERFTLPLVAALRIAPPCLVCGDTTPYAKPHPAPLFHAAALLGLPAEHCAYVGDDLRDIQAARAAGMRAIAVAYGYHGIDNGGPEAWDPDAVIARPESLLGLL